MCYIDTSYRNVGKTSIAREVFPSTAGPMLSAVYTYIMRTQEPNGPMFSKFWDAKLHHVYSYVCLRTCDYLGVYISYVAGLKWRNYSRIITK